MKKTAITVAILLTLSAGFAAAQEAVTAQIVSGPQERLGLMKGDVVSVNAGARDGIIKGDIGTIATTGETALSGPIGKCAVVKTFDALSKCEIIKADREIERGHTVFFSPVRFTDPLLYPAMLSVLSSLVDPYRADRIVKVYLYNIYDGRGDVTKLSEQIREELRLVLAQKKRIQLIDSRMNKEIAFYPEDYPVLAQRMKDYQKKSDIDVVLWGAYRIEGDKLLLTLTMIDRHNKDRQQTFLLPFDTRYASASKDLVIPYGQIRKIEDVNCTIILKTVPARISKDDRGPAIRREAAGNPFVEQQLRTVDFSILGATDVIVAIDGDPVSFGGKESHTLILPRGTHRISTSYKRGYFVQEALVYKSTKDTSRDVLLDVSRSRDLTIEISYLPSSDTDPIHVRVYRKADKELTVLRPIIRVEADRPLELFKD